MQALLYQAVPVVHVAGTPVEGYQSCQLCGLQLSVPPFSCFEPGVFLRHIKYESASGLVVVPECAASEMCSLGDFDPGEADPAIQSLGELREPNVGSQGGQ